MHFHLMVSWLPRPIKVGLPYGSRGGILSQAWRSYHLEGFGRRIGRSSTLAKSGIIIVLHSSYSLISTWPISLI